MSDEFRLTQRLYCDSSGLGILIVRDNFIGVR